MGSYGWTTAAIFVGLSACSSQEGPVAQDEVSSTGRESVTASLTTTRTPTAGASSSPGRAIQPHAEIAASSLDTLAQLVGSRAPSKRGFDSVEEVQSATLGAPLPVFVVGLNRLIAHHPGQDVRTLLVDKHEVMYPVIVDGKARTSVVVKQRAGGQWEAVEFGHANVARAAHAGRQSVSEARHVSEPELFLVQIPSLSATFLGHEEDGVLMLTSLYPISGAAIRAGATYPANQVVAFLQPAAAQLPLTVPR